MKTTCIKWMLCLAGLLPLAGHADVANISGPTWYDYRDTSWNPDESGFVTISTAGQLAQFAWLVNEEGLSFEHVYVGLSADIDLTKTSADGKRVSWVPIGYQKDKCFKGVFTGVDIEKAYSTQAWTAGDSHIIKGMYINAKPTDAMVYMGFFGYMDGYVGHLTLKDAKLIYAISTNQIQNYIGLLCGYAYGTPSEFRNSHEAHYNNWRAIYNVTVEGDIEPMTEGTNKKLIYIGGIVGYCKNVGIAHSTFKGTIQNNIGGYIAGICGHLNADNDNKPHITDCAAVVEIVNANNAGTLFYSAGIVGSIYSNSKVEGCFVSGSIIGRIVGGICSDFDTNNTRGEIIGCVCTAELSSTDATDGTVGGIVGRLGCRRQAPKLLKHCVFAGHINNRNGKRMGGLCGAMNDDDVESITQSFMLGTMEKSTDSQVKQGVIVGQANNALSTVTYCYYDKTLCGGMIVGSGDPDRIDVLINGLTTEELTSGDMEKTIFIESDDSSPTGFTLRKGYYPMLYFKGEWPGYQELSVTSGTMSETGKHFWAPEGEGRSNTVYCTGAWVASVPVIIPKGDVAYDLVTQVSVGTKKGSWQEMSRNMSVESIISFKGDDNVVKVDGNTAKVLADGEFDLTISTKMSKKQTALATRPQPLSVTKTLHFKATPDQLWDGYPSGGYAGGTGKAEDPYLIKTGAQLAYAVKNNKEGEFYQQICDINLNNTLLTESFLKSHQNKLDGGRMWVADAEWKANYNGDGHYVKGLWLRQMYFGGMDYGLFCRVTSTGTISNLGVVDCFLEYSDDWQYLYFGVLAGRMAGTISNCLVQGYHMASSHSGGLCAVVEQGGLVENCVSAVYSQMLLAVSNFTPIVSLDDRANKGSVQNCLSVAPVYFRVKGTSVGNLSCIDNCYWLKGYETFNSGQTLEEIGEGLTASGNGMWTWNEGYFPMLSTFANTDMGKLLSVPIRTDEGYTYDAGNDRSPNCLLGFCHQVAFEPGAASWNLAYGETYMEMDADMGIIAPIRSMWEGEMDFGDVDYLFGRLGKFQHIIPVSTSQVGVQPGITFVDDHARDACLAAFDTNRDNILSLAELKAVTNGQTLTAFQTNTGRQIKQFPEFRFFKSVTELTTQLNNLSALEQVKLPYALKKLGSEAFKGCDNLTSITIPSRMDEVKPRAFYGSSVRDITIDKFNKTLVVRDHALFDCDDALIAYPNGRATEEIVISGTVTAIGEGAIYKVPGLRRLYFDTNDYTTVPTLGNDGLTTDDGSLMDVFVSDATYDHILYDDYLAEDSWDTYAKADKLHRYYPLKVESDVMTDYSGSNKYAGTLYIGFDTELPKTLTPYLVAKADQDENKAYIMECSRRLPATTPILILADQPGIYRLSPIEGESLEQWPMYENALIGSNRDGVLVYQKDAAQGSVLSPAIDKQGNFVFAYDKNDEIPPYHAYLSYNTVGKTPEQALNTFYHIEPALILEAIDYTEGDYIYDVYRNMAYNQSYAYLKSYSGMGGNITPPARFSNNYPLVRIAPDAFAQAQGDIWSIDFSSCTELDRIHVDRTEPDNPFYGFDDRTIIYLPGNMSHTAGKSQQNVVIGTECSRLEITDTWDYKPPYEFTAERVDYNRILSATDNGDGTWSSHAYTVCLPYDLDLSEEHNSERILVCKLYFIKDNKEFIFSNTFPEMEAGNAYLIVVNEGELSLGANNVRLIAQETEGEEVLSWYSDEEKVIGRWRGLFHRIYDEEAESLNMYGMQAKDGRWERYYVTKHGPRWCWLDTFRAIFQADESTGNNTYKSVFKQYVAGDDDDPIVDFPADFFDGDDINGESTDIQPFIHIESNGTHQYYDLQGRKLNGKPTTKGIYIDNGKKVVSTGIKER